MTQVFWRIDKREFSKASIDADLGETLNERARGLGVAPSTLSRVLRGEAQPGGELLARMRLRFGAEVFERILQAEDVA